MFGQQLASDVQQYLERLEKQRQQKVGVDEASAGLTLGGDALRVPFLDFATATPKRHQTVVPGVGTLHDCCEHSPLFSAVARRLLFNSLVPAQLRGRDFGGDHTAKLEFLAPELVRAVARLRFRECAPEDAVPQRNAYYSVLNTFQALHRSEAFRQLVHFVRDFAQLLKTSFRASSLAETTGPPKKRAKVDVATHGQTYGTLELFQKMILMHATYFLAAVLLGDHAEQVNTFLRLVFEIPLFSDTAVRHFRQRATVFLVPRRHGKTWFLVPLIALSLASFRGIKIGYTAHIRKATEPVFDEIDACLRGWFGSSRVDHVKGETISFSFPDGSRSTIVFASSHNTNVSTPSSRGACFPGAALPEIDRQTNTARRECGTTRPQPPPRHGGGEALLFICNRTMRLWPRPARPRGSSLQTGGWYTMTERRGATRRWSGG
uniref:UL15_1 n=1 Tax=Human herpesvirus 2 TaxID=10310 RepID=A0A481TE18_HHV2|nr:UL15_1 [Human alphaherpesvirus 2]QBH77945.1 UL15_1 [Human alphaherpesvirus 2]QBH78022.1 UL15_1 [Human alphaherpesvirus 2]QBH79458.1 UL15_1 [Human alphaherpesvirus 2]QBH80561.1 UL15_1 [Human alphaherpesvirus 2]